jgi:hypothetical protein
LQRGLTKLARIGYPPKRGPKHRFGPQNRVKVVFEKSEISNGGLSEKVTKSQIGPIFVGQIRFAGDWCVFVSGGHFGPPESQTDLRDFEPCFPLQGIVLWGVKGTLTPVAQGVQSHRHRFSTWWVKNVLRVQIGSNRPQNEFDRRIWVHFAIW